MVKLSGKSKGIGMARQGRYELRGRLPASRLKRAETGSSGAGTGSTMEYLNGTGVARRGRVGKPQLVSSSTKLCVTENAWPQNILRVYKQTDLRPE